MRTKRILSVLLAACLLFGLIPAAAMPVRAANADPVYNRAATPEYIIFNAKSGDSEDYFKSVMKDSKFNAVADGKFVLYNSDTKLKYDTKVSQIGLSEYVWDDFRFSNLANLSDMCDELEVGLAVTLTNNPHKHTYDLLYTANILSYMDVVLSKNVMDIGDGIYKANGYSKSMTTLRRGNATFRDIPAAVYATSEQNGAPLVLNFWNYEKTYDGGTRTCKCGGSAKDTVVSFYDGTAPELVSMDLSAIRGGVAIPYCWDFGKGDIINIELTFSEPLRFADDKAAGKGDVCVGLMVSGHTDQIPAYLTSLDGNKLTFQCEAPSVIPTGETGVWSVTGVDLTGSQTGGKGLMSKKTMDTGIPLTYIYGNNKTYTATKPNSASSAVGYTEATSYVTDMAGNSLIARYLNNYIIIEDNIIPRSFYIDIQDPYVARADIIPSESYNADVKQLLGKTGMTPNTANYEDASDRYLGVGDSFKVKLYMNELLYCSTWPTIKLNITYDGNPNWKVELNSLRSYTASATDVSADCGLGISKGQVTVFETGYFVITDDMQVDPASEDGVVVIESINFGNGVTDYADNPAQNVTSQLDIAQDFLLDTDLPSVSLDPAVQIGGVNNSFYVPFTTTDSGSGVLRLPGKLKLQDPSGSTLPFQYAFTDSPNTPSAWSSGTMGSYIEFSQTMTKQYLHFKPVSGAAYNFDDNNPAALVFNLMDYAGNVGDGSPQYITGAAMDSLPPTVKATGSSRGYDNITSAGTLSVDIDVQDVSDVSKVEYTWQVYTVDRDAVELLLDSSWTASVKENDAWIAEAAVPGGTLFQKNLWVRATDAFDYTSLTNLGEFSYDLASDVKFELEYSTDIQTKASLKFTEYDSETGLLVIDVMQDNSDVHMILLVSDEILERKDIFQNLFDQTFVFSQAEINNDNGVRYTEEQGWYYKPFEDYTGNLYVTVYSGNENAIECDDWYYVGEEGNKTAYRDITINNTASVQRFTLRQAALSATAYDVFSGDVKTLFTPASSADDDKLTGVVTVVPWTVDSQERYSTTLAGVQVKFNLGGDKNGWDYEDIDWQNSFLDLYKGGNVSPTENATEREKLLDGTFRLCAIGSGPVQTITLPDSDLYDDFLYGDIYLVLARRSAPDSPYFIRLNKTGRINLDDTEPGVLELQHLGREYAPEELSPDGRYHDIPFDPSTTIYIPAESTPVVLSVEAMTESCDEDGETSRESYNLHDENGKGYRGAMDIVAWNTDEPDTRISLDRSWLNYSVPYNGGVIEEENDIQMYRRDDLSDKTGKRLLGFGPETDAAAGVIGLTPDQDNIVALQIVYANGRTSGVTYLTIHPVTIRAEGTVSIETKDGLQLSAGSIATVGPDEATVVFTPSAGTNTLGLEFYIARSFTDVPIPMVARSDGSYAATVPNADFWNYFDGQHENENIYPGMIYPMGHSNMYLSNYRLAEDPPCFFLVYAGDQYGNEHLAGTADWGVIPDATPPMFVSEHFNELGEIEDHGDGTYTASFRIIDDSLFAWDASAGDYMSRPMDLEFFYEAKYAEAAGKPAGHLTLTGVEDGFTWTASEGNDLGVYRVTAERTRYVAAVYEGGVEEAYPVLEVTVEGVISPEVTSAADMTLFLRATDAHGNVNGWALPDPDDEYYEDIFESGYCQVDNPGFVTAWDVTGGKPEAVDWRYVPTGAGDDMGLEIAFNMPVLPEASWIDPDPGAQGFSCVWQDAFPIWKDGEWTISFYDAYGNLYNQTLTLDDVIGDYGIDLSFSTLDYVAAETGVVITAAEDGAGETVTGSTTATANGVYTVERTAGGKTDVLTIHLTNIVSGGPETRVFFYLEEFGEMYEAGAEDQFQGTTYGPVVVSYSTDRETSPVGENTMTFRSGDNDEFIFQYYDIPTDFTYTISGKLYEDYGITLGAPPEPVPDEEAPLIDLVTIWKQRGGGFEQTNAFPGSAEETDIRSTIEESGLAQSFDFVVKASDYSPWKVLVMAAPPSGSISYDTPSDVIDGVSVQGNNVLVDKNVAADFYIVAVDHATADKAAPASADNYSWIRIPYGSYRFDTTPPVIEYVTISESMYSKVVYLRATDLDDDGNETAGTVLSGAGVVEETVTIDGVVYTHKLIFKDNDTVTVVTATDGAGNSTTENIQVSGIDVTAPTLYVTWSPCFSNTAGDDLDPNNPPMGPVNVNVVAHIASDKPIYSVTANDGEELIFNEDHIAETAWGAVEYNAERITVRFTTKETAGVTLTVTAPNGKSTDQTVLLGAGVIDKDAPVVIETVEPVMRAGFTVPYAETHTLGFDENVFCMNSGTVGVLYNFNDPFTVTLTDNNEASFRFVDKAGNVTVYTVVPKNVIDNTRPVVSSEVADDANATNGAVAVTVIADEWCTLTAKDRNVSCGAMTESTDENGDIVWIGTVSVSQNGTFRVTAADAAGNTADTTFTVNNIDKVLPNLSFTKSIVSVRQDSAESALTALLDAGVTAWDNVEIAEGTLSYDTSEVDLTLSGVYPVTYTVEDIVGNVGQAIRYVKVVDKYQLIIAIDGELTEPDGVINVDIGTHTLEVSGLRQENEPYTLKLIEGMWSEGQMKRVTEEMSIPVDSDGKFTLTSYNAYTLYIVTQSRQTYRTLLNVDK